MHIADEIKQRNRFVPVHHFQYDISAEMNSNFYETKDEKKLKTEHFGRTSIIKIFNKLSGFFALGREKPKSRNVNVDGLSSFQVRVVVFLFFSKRIYIFSVPNSKISSLRGRNSFVYNWVVLKSHHRVASCLEHGRREKNSAAA